MTFSHYSGGARAQVQCVGNNASQLRRRQRVPAGSAAGIVPYQATLYRDQLLNNDWWTYNGYIQDSYSRGRMRLNGGLRYDWQQSKYLGGCVPANSLRPDLLPAQCEAADATMSDAITGRPRRRFSRSATGRRACRPPTTCSATARRRCTPAIRTTTQTKITLADALGGLFTRRPDVGPEPVERRLQHHGGRALLERRQRRRLVQANELIGTPTSSSTRFDINTGVLTPAGNIVDPSAKIGRTREAIVGHPARADPEPGGRRRLHLPQVRPRHDHLHGRLPAGRAGIPAVAQIYIGPLSYTDPVTGLSGAVLRDLHAAASVRGSAASR